MKPQIKTFQEALTYHLETMYYAEKSVQKTFKGLSRRLTTSALQMEVGKYLDGASDKRLKLKRIFSYLLAGPYRKGNAVADQLLAEAKDAFQRSRSPLLREALFIADLQNLIHYKIAAYGTAKAFAEQLGLATVTGLLDEILHWEKDADKALTKIALQVVNVRAGRLVVEA